ncbi:MAPEG family protein [Marinobacter litoralis]|uniref:MAPEG family protein n=1 Tax=Marinobacter litoralis TaxID=187981 RepID=UPI0018EA9E07|nr:MAPEG family protein [Marinobacter litoralis]MBJ6136996.1 MAPEG family protein [Marinobacter litoralis]
MSSTAILYPAFAMFVLTMTCIFRLGTLRFFAVRARKVRLSYYRTYNEGTQPDYLHLMARHVQNHFEVPPLFYIGIIFGLVTGNTAMITLIFAWAFVAARVVHSVIHLTNNNVNYRFFVFVLSLVCLCGLWGSVMFPLL